MSEHIAASSAAATTADTTAHADTVFSIGGVTIDLTATDGVAIGGAGNDTISVHTLDFGLIDGGTGIDTLLLAGTNQHLDLTLLGLKVGTSIHWELPGGASAHLEVLELLYQPEAAGEFHR